MIALLEEAAQSSVAPELEEGQSTVGTGLSVSHEAATPVGMKVWVHSMSFSRLQWAVFVLSPS